MVECSAFETSHSHKIDKTENFINRRISFLYNLEIYLHKQIWLNLTRQFSQIWSIYAKNGHFFMQMAIFPISRNTAFVQVLVKQKELIIERLMTPY